jgi:hypothetical protein
MPVLTKGSVKLLFLRSDSSGNLRSTVEEVGTAFTHFFQDLFSSEGTSGLEEVVRLVPTRVTQRMNELFIKAFSLI